MAIGNNLPGMMLATISWWHIALVVLLVLLLFGGKKLPELARGLGKSMRIFRDEISGLHKDITEPPPAKPEEKTFNPPSGEPIEKK